MSQSRSIRTIILPRDRGENSAHWVWQVASSHLVMAQVLDHLAPVPVIESLFVDLIFYCLLTSWIVRPGRSLWGRCCQPQWSGWAPRTPETEQVRLKPIALTFAVAVPLPSLLLSLQFLFLLLLLLLPCCCSCVFENGLLVGDTVSCSVQLKWVVKTISWKIFWIWDFELYTNPISTMQQLRWHLSDPHLALGA